MLTNNKHATAHYLYTRLLWSKRLTETGCPPVTCERAIAGSVRFRSVPTIVNRTVSTFIPTRNLPKTPVSRQQSPMCPLLIEKFSSGRGRPGGAQIPALDTIRVVKWLKFPRRSSYGRTKKAGPQRRWTTREERVLWSDPLTIWTASVLIRNCPFVDTFRTGIEQCKYNELRSGPECYEGTLSRRSKICARIPPRFFNRNYADVCPPKLANTNAASSQERPAWKKSSLESRYKQNILFCVVLIFIPILVASQSRYVWN